MNRHSLAIEIAQRVGSILVPPGTIITHLIEAVEAEIEGLVIIDPEDRVQVKRLHMTRERVAGFGVERTQAALREFAKPTPPKPEEPTGLGAVVEDASGIRWVRWEGMFALPWCAPNEPSCKYSDIAAVRVLSEGVTDV